MNLFNGDFYVVRKQNPRTGKYYILIVDKLSMSTAIAITVRKIRKTVLSKFLTLTDDNLRSLYKMLDNPAMVLNYNYELNILFN